MTSYIRIAHLETTWSAMTRTSFSYLFRKVVTLIRPTHTGPLFQVIPIASGYVIAAIWPDGTIDILAGVYNDDASAARWISDHAYRYVGQRTAPSPTQSLG
jgi:hypothetical protein